MTEQRIYRFSITVHVEAGQTGYDDPEWIADAATGALTNEYGIESFYEGVEEVTPGVAP